jgi:23S rRNA (uracil1939-C5)-methyltransferase
MNKRHYPVKRGGEYELKIEKLAFGGAGIARMDNYVIFVNGAIPGDRILVRIQKRKSAFAEAKLLSIVEPSKHRIEPPCPYFEWCGGCTWQNLSYDDQLKYKQDIIAESFKYIAGLEHVHVQPIIASDKPFSYRNKMEFSFSDRRWLLPDELNVDHIRRDFALGLHIPGTFDKVLQIDKCLLQSEKANQILLFIKEYVVENKLQPYGIRTHEGFLRFLVIRESSYDSSIMINLVTAYENTKVLKKLAQKLIKRFPTIKSVVNNINSKLAQIAVGEIEILLAGETHIQEKLGRHLFNISANSFFQTNTKQTERLYNKVIEFADLNGNQNVWDLYCGTGAITIFLADQSKEVVGFELVESAVNDARVNAKLHGIENAKFIGGDLLYKLQEMKDKPDVLVTDPPRSGMHAKVVEYIRDLQPAKIVYISCNPSTLARDISILKDVYEIEIIQPVDMFPQTYHIETIVKMKSK